MESLEGLGRNYLDKIKKIQPSSRARTRVAELVSRYLKFIDWNSETCINDQAVIFMLSCRFVKFKSYKELEKIFKWVEKKDCLKPQQIFKILVK